MQENMYFVNSVKVFGFLDTSVIAYRLYGSNAQGRKAIEALTVRSCRSLTGSFLLKKKEKRKKISSDRWRWR